MNNLKVLTTAVALLFATPVLAQEMGGATGPGSASGYEGTYYSGYDQGGGARRYRSYDSASGTYLSHNRRRHSSK
jgi:hypothetical protein